jgi:hypothetical protein
VFSYARGVVQVMLFLLACYKRTIMSSETQVSTTKCVSINVLGEVSELDPKPIFAHPTINIHVCETHKRNQRQIQTQLMLNRCVHTLSTTRKQTVQSEHNNSHTHTTHKHTLAKTNAQTDTHTHIQPNLSKR